MRPFLVRCLSWTLLPALAAAGGYWAGHAGADRPPVITQVEEALGEPPREPERAKPLVETPVVAELMVSVTGGVRRPGAYSLPVDARIQDLIGAAGGATLDGVLDDINIAARLLDGSVLTIPQRGLEGARVIPAARVNPPSYTRSGWRAPRAAPAAGAQAAGGRIDLNTASQAMLETLPGVGPVTAGKIIEYRRQTPFARVEDLTNIHGIGEKTLESLRPHVTVR